MHALKRFLLGFTVLVAVLIGVLFLWGLVEPYVLDEEKQVAALPDLPPAWEGKTFALMADWQLGMWLGNTSTIRRAVERLVEERPAFVLIAGDFVYHAGTGQADETRHAARLVRPLTRAAIPVYAVLGNHDYGMQKPDGQSDEQLARRLTAALEAAGVRVLQNEAVALRPPGITGNRLPDAQKTLYLVGVGPSWPGHAASARALAQVPEEAPRLALMHNPNAFEDFPAGAAPVALAGHTHGGQVRLPFTPQQTWMTYFKSDAVHADGWIPSSYGQGTNRLYVNRGIGFSLLPLRLNAAPELTLFTLQGR